VKDRPIDGPVDDPRSVKPVEVQGREYSIIRSIIIGHTLDHPLPRRRSPEAVGHGQGDSCFADEFQAVDVEVLHGPAEGEAQTSGPMLCRALTRGAIFFYRQLEALSFPADRRGADLRALRSSEPLPQFLQRCIGLLFNLTAQEGGMVYQGTPPASRMGFGGTAATAAKPLPRFLHA